MSKRRKMLMDPIIHPSNSLKEYRSIKLDNGLQAILVSDDSSSVAACSLTVRFGSFNDPPDIQGLAHFIEHIIFAGSERFRGSNELRDFVSKFGGDANAHTEMEYSVFSMSVNSKRLEDALERFAHLFIKPLMPLDHFGKEIDIINSEFELERYKDASRLEQLQLHTSPKGHPFNRFPWGNKSSLSELDSTSLRERAMDFFNRYFISSSMKLVLVGEETLDDLEGLAQRFFRDINKGDGAYPKSEYKPNIWNADVSYLLQSVEHSQSLSIYWMLPPLSSTDFSTRPENCLVHLLSQENEGSLCYLFKQKGWISSFIVKVGTDSSFVTHDDDESTSFTCTSLGRTFTIDIDLTDNGLEEKYQIVSFVYHYLNLLRHQVLPLPGHIQQEYSHSLKMKFDALDYDDNSVDDSLIFTQRLAANMLKCPPSHALSLDYFIDFGGIEAIHKVLQYFTPQNMSLYVLSNQFKGEEIRTEPWFSSKYIEEKIPPQFKSAWLDHSSLSSPILSLQFPSPNEFMPSSFMVVMNEETDEETDEDTDEETDEDTDGSLLEVEHLLAEDSGNLYYIAEPGLLSSAFFTIDFSVGQGIKYHMITKLFIKMVNDLLSPILHQGAEGYINTHLSVLEDNKLELRFSGYKEKFSEFISTIWNGFTSFNPTPQHFNIISEVMRREFLASSVDITEHATRMLSETIFEDVFTFDDKFKALGEISYEDVLEFIRLWLSSEIHTTGLCFGVLSRGESDEIFHLFKKAGTSGVPVPKKLRFKKELKRGSPLKIDVKPVNEYETKSLAKVYFQLSGDKDKFAEEAALLNLFKSIIEEKLWHQLRQKEALGFDVGCDIHYMCGINGFYVYIVSSLHKPEFLLKRINNFIGTIGEILNGVSDRDFKNYKEGALSCLGESGKHVWDLLVEDSYMDDHYSRGGKIVKEVTKEELIGFYEAFFTPSMCRSVEVCIRGRNAEDQVHQ